MSLWLVIALTVLTAVSVLLSPALLRLGMLRTLLPFPALALLQTSLPSRSKEDRFSLPARLQGLSLFNHVQKAVDQMCRTLRLNSQKLFRRAYAAITFD